MAAYATATDYAEVTGVPDDYDATERARIDAGLLNAQDDINAAIRFQVYDITDEATATALTRATCQQFARHEETGDTGTGAASEYQTVRFGSVTLSRGDSNSTAGTNTRGKIQYSPRALATLTAAGLQSSIVGRL